ncbi:GGDEF domain-containing protein [Magnetospirillum sp. UT-4]|uniref:GGDEF domain-containing protein n=1 Tax=Magnetospirillum sp. UT-4 TaxID=2681467 RepID=UPI001382C694|nr:GGDEF domain-containing protein [Magnetospirillum sp. UT-4]CAA7613365.1 conserved hypothetical protein [Magnetospirillum sp. UT-4]
MINFNHSLRKGLGLADGRAAQPPTPQPEPQPADGRWAQVLARLDVALQPIVHFHTGACYGFEALLRDVEAAGFANASALLAEAHAAGVLAEVEAKAHEMALAKFVGLETWRQSKLFLNLDGRSWDAGLVGRMRSMIERYGVEEAAVVFELAEHDPLSHTAAADGPLAPHRRGSFKLAVDDQGTGHSGLRLLYHAAPEFVKVDRFFIAGIATDSKKRLFLSQIVNLAHLLGVVVIAEGIETEREFFVCKEVGCDLAQGFLIQAPATEVGALRASYGDVEALARSERRVTVSDQKLIGDQIAYVVPIVLGSRMEDVFERFRSDKSSTFFPVVDSAGEPVGIVRDRELKEYTYSPFGKDLISNKIIGRKLRDFTTRCPMADINTKAEHILQAYSAVENSEGIIIVDNMKYVGFLSAHSLLRVINEKNLAAARDQNPLTKLPGNNLIHDYVAGALADTDTHYTLAYFDFDNFKPFNDKYGFRLGDRAILMFAELLARELACETCFPAHIGGDDFFGGYRQRDFDLAVESVRRIIATFRRDVESFYDDETRLRGYISGQDRQGNPTRFPLMSVSAAVVQLRPGRGAHTVDEVSQLIAGLKKEAKKAEDRMASAAMVG